MDAIIKKSKPKGKINAPPSKSMAHRLLICAGLCRGKSIIHNINLSNDIQATINCLKALGAKINITDDAAEVEGIDFSNKDFVNLDCGESGSTIRFFLPICAYLGREAILTGTKKLISRPMSMFEKICKDQDIIFEKGIYAISKADEDNIHIKGQLKANTFIVPGNQTSQFISGLLYILPLMENDSKIIITGDIQSRSYIEMTVSALSKFGVIVNFQGNTIYISGRYNYRPSEVTVENDYSNAAFLDALNLIGGQVTVTGLKKRSLQGDSVYKDYFQALKNNSAFLDLANCPDLGPILFAMAGVRAGASFNNVERLVLKESNRLEAMQEELAKFGIKLIISPNGDSCQVNSKHIKLFPLKKVIDSHNDHRVAMAMAIIASKYGGVIKNAECVNKSYPNFWKDLKSLGVKVKLV